MKTNRRLNFRYGCREKAVEISIWAGLLTETKQNNKRSLHNKADDNKTQQTED